MKFKSKQKQKEIVYTSENPNVEQDCFDELKEVSKLSIARKEESQLFKDNTDANYFTCLIFNNKAQLDEFIQKVGIHPEDKQYINGLELAEKLGINIETKSRTAPKSFKISSKLVDLSM